MRITINFQAVQTIYALNNKQVPKFINVSEDLLQAITFDFSIQSLYQIEYFFLNHYATHEPDDLKLLGFYIAEIFARLTHHKIYWYESDQIIQAKRSDLKDTILQKFFTLDQLNDAIVLKQSNFISLLAEKLEIKIPNENIKQTLVEIPQEYNKNHLKALKQLNLKSLKSFLSQRPLYCSQEDPLYAYFDEIDILLKHGSKIRCHIVQANQLLFKAQYVGGCPAEVIYDPCNKLLDEDLEAFASYLFSLRHQPDLNTYEQILAEHLNNEMQRVLGEYLPMDIFGYPLCTATIYIDQKYLPNGVLVNGNLPALIAPQFSRFILLLPAQFWHSDLIDQWELSAYDQFGKEVTLEQMMIDAGVSNQAQSQLNLFKITVSILVILFLVTLIKMMV